MWLCIALFPFRLKATLHYAVFIFVYRFSYWDCYWVFPNANEGRCQADTISCTKFFHVTAKHVQRIESASAEAFNSTSQVDSEIVFYRRSSFWLPETRVFSTGYVLRGIDVTLITMRRGLPWKTSALCICRKSTRRQDRLRASYTMCFVLLN